MKIWKVIKLAIISIVLAKIIQILEDRGCLAISTITSIVLGIVIPSLWHAVQDCVDTSDWKKTQRGLMRGGFVKDETLIRISFAYLFRIKLGNKYLLVENNRGTGKYQPVGGVYKLKASEKEVLKRKFYVMDDNKIALDGSSRDDYRLRVQNRFLRKFVKRFDFMAERECINDLSREFREELINNGILDWDQITYRYCGRHMTELQFSDHFQSYELLLADVVELILTEKQKMELGQLLERNSSAYIFATADEITSLGVNTEAGILKETIADHAKKIIEENEVHLKRHRKTGKKFTVSLGN